MIKLEQWKSQLENKIKFCRKIDLNFNKKELLIEISEN